MITIREIAKLANVSRGTVDRVLNNRPGVSEETIVKVRTIADEYGYEPNALGQMLAAKKKHLHFGFIVFDTPVDFFFHDVIKAAEEKAVELKTFGVEVTIFRLKSLKETDVKKELDMIEEERLDGINTLVTLYSTYSLKVDELTILIKEFHSYPRHIKSLYKILVGMFL